MTQGSAGGDGGGGGGGVAASPPTRICAREEEVVVVLLACETGGCGCLWLLVGRLSGRRTFAAKGGSTISCCTTTHLCLVHLLFVGRYGGGELKE